jgi:hypothetical protein
MAKKSIFLIAVLVFLAYGIVAWADDTYWTYCHQYFAVAKNSTTGDGNFMMYDASYGSDSMVATSTGDDTFSWTYAMANSSGVSIRPDAFSFNTGITAWLAQTHKSLYYSVAQVYDENGPTSTKFGSNDDIRVIDNGANHGFGTNIQWSAEAIVKHVEPRVQTPYPNNFPLPPNSYGLPLPDHTLGMPDLVLDSYGQIQGRGVRGNELALADFQVSVSAPDPDQRLYFSAGRYAQFQFGGTYYGLRSGVLWKKTTGPVEDQFQGSDYNGRANAGDILTCAGLATNPTYGIFEYAWKIAGTMLGDKFWDSGLVWNNTKGYVATSTASNAAEVTGHSAMRNFMRYIFDITAMKVEDVNGNGKFDSGDTVMFVLASDKYYDGMKQWTDAETWYSKTDVLTGQYFAGGLGGAIYLYTSTGVVTYMGKSANMFFGQSAATGNATIWGEKFGSYDITGFDLTTYIPEPSAMMLIIGAGLALGAGVLRKKVR